MKINVSQRGNRKQSFMILVAETISYIIKYLLVLTFSTARGATGGRNTNINHNNHHHHQHCHSLYAIKTTTNIHYRATTMNTITFI